MAGEFPMEVVETNIFHEHLILTTTTPRDAGTGTNQITPRSVIYNFAAFPNLFLTGVC